MSQDGRVRRTQAERSAETRAKLLEAAIDCLAELGWSATTTPEVAKRAGLSRGAQQYHFPTKADLLISVTRYITERFHDDIRSAFKELPAGSERPRAAIEAMWKAYTGPRALAHTEIWVASRTDPELHAALYEVERSLVRETGELLRNLFAADSEHGEQLNLLADISAQFIRGLVVLSMLSGDSRRVQQDLEGWKEIAEVVVTSIESGSGLLSDGLHGGLPVSRGTRSAAGER